MAANRPYNLLECSFVEVQEWLKETDVVLIPIGSCEKHGPHIPLGTDSYVTMAVVEKASEKGNVPHAPLMPYGYSPHHMGEVNGGYGSITLRGDTFRNVLYDIGRSLVYHGFNKLIFVSHHGSNTKVMDDALRALRYDTGALPVWYKVPTERDIKLIKDLFKSPPEDAPGWHSGEEETAILMYYKPELVKMERAQPRSIHAPKWLGEKFIKTDGTPTIEFMGSENIWIPLEHHEYSDNATIGDPFTGTPEGGKAMVERISDHLAAFAEELKKVDVIARVRDFPERAFKV
jgi:creatinine amidohydrolase